MSDLKEIERAAARLERAMDEAYSRYLGADEAARTAGVADALRHALDDVPESLRRFLLEMLAERYEPDAPRTDERAAIEIASLRSENQRLEAEVLTLERAQQASAGLVAALLGEAATVEWPEVDAHRAHALIAATQAFVQTLAESLLVAPGRRGAKPAVTERVQGALTAQLSGEQPDAWDALLAELKSAIAAHLGAVRPACREGGAFLLQQLDPMVLEADESIGQAQGLGALFANKERELWRVFERRHARLVKDEELYETYFSPYYNKWLHELLRKNTKT